MTGTQQSPGTWRLVDIVTASVIGVVAGVVFWGWGVWTLPLFSGQVNPLAYLLSGIWLVAGVLAMLIVRKPGAALFAELVAAVVSALLGSYWGLDVVLSGAVQGAGAELVFAVFLYRSYGLPVALLAGAGAAVGEWIHDMPVYYPDVSFGLQLSYGAFMLVSGIVLAGLGSWLLIRALAQTGVLAPFPSGRSQRPV